MAMIVATGFRRAALVLAILATIVACAYSAEPIRPAAAPAAGPRAFVDTDFTEPAGAVRRVGPGGDLQGALDDAVPGTIIELAPGAVYRGPFTLPRKSGEEWILIRSGDGSGLPGPDTRIGPEDADAMAKLEAVHGAVIEAAPGAHHYRFVGVEIRPGMYDSGVHAEAGHPLGREGGNVPDQAYLDNLVILSDNPETMDAMPHHIIFDRCYLHGSSGAARRGIAMNSAHTAVINSHLADFKKEGRDAQAIAAWGGSGPYRIVNNYLEAAAENVLIGGADPAIEELVPADIEVRRNHFAKPLNWKKGEVGYEGKNWTVKNLFELKNARRVLVDGNLFEYNWPHKQDGFAILFTVRNQQGSAPWSVIEDVTFSNNIVRHVAAGVNMLGHDDNGPSEQTRRVEIRNNLFADLGGQWGNGKLFQFLDGVADVTISHNTALNTDNIISSDGRPHPRMVFTDNIVMHNRYGIIGADTGIGMLSLQRHFPEATVAGNVMINGPARSYPAGNFFPNSLEDVGFIDAAGGDYRLRQSSPYRNSSGEFAGVDFQALCNALAATERPPYCPAGQ